MAAPEALRLHAVGATATADDPVVGIEGFGKRYRRKVAVQDVSLRIAQGQLFGLIGADGAGKSSLMKAVAGVLSYEAGSVTVFGRRIDSERAAEGVKARLGFMPQGLGLNLYPELSVEENVDFFARMRGVPGRVAATRKEQLLAMTRLAPFRGRPMKNLSGGMKQKLGLVCTLIHAPELIVLDEPTTGVDPVSRRDFWIILAQLVQDRRLTALVSTAYLDEASRFDCLALMQDGHVLAHGEPDRLVRAAGARIVELAADAVPLDGLMRRFAQVDVRADTARAYVELDDDASALGVVREALGGAAAPPLAVHEPDLEDVFVALLRTRSGVARDPVVPAGRAVCARKGEDPAIDAHALTRDFGAFRAVDGASFGVHYGEIFGLLGANGAGKTTVIKMLTGILPPSGGTGRVAGADMRRAGQAIKERVGYMSQAFSLYTELTVLENLLLFAGVYGLERRLAEERAREVVALGGLHGCEDEPAGALPMGLRQRLALGCALIHRPRVLFLDEPTSGVDPIGRRRFWSILRQLAREQAVAILLTTHAMGEAELCDRLALMFAGRVVADATPADMKAELARAQGQLLEVRVEAPMAPMAALAALHAAGFPGAILHGRAIRLMARDVDAARRRIGAALHGAGLAAPRIAPRPLSMEDVFVHRVLALEAAVAGQRP